MGSDLHERDDDVTFVSNLRRILRDGLQITAASSFPASVVILVFSPQSYEAVLNKVHAQIPRAEREDTRDGLTDRPVAGKRPPSKNRSAQSRSSARM